MVYDNDGPIYSVLTAKACSTDFNATGLRDPGCPCMCQWVVGYNGDYVNNATSCPPGGELQSWDPEQPGYYSCYVLADCNCDNPSFSAPGSIFTILDPIIGICNGAHMICGVCIDGQCTYASIYPPE